MVEPNINKKFLEMFKEDLGQNHKTFIRDIVSCNLYPILIGFKEDLTKLITDCDEFLINLHFLKIFGCLG